MKDRKEKKDRRIIPRGEFCYSADETGTHYCPYLERLKNGGLYCSYCKYCCEAEEIGRYDKHMWDMTKACGERL